MKHKRLNSLNNQGNGGHGRQNFAEMMQLKRRKITEMVGMHDGSNAGIQETGKSRNMKDGILWK